MSKNNKTLIILFVVLTVVLLIYFVSTSNGGNKYQWHENYSADSKQPYGTLYIRKLLEGFRPNGKVIENSKKPLAELLDSANLKNPTDYVFIGQSIYLDVVDKEALFNFIYKGHDAFVSSLEIPEDLLTRVYSVECNAGIEYERTEAISAAFNFYHDTLQTAGGYTYTYRYGAENVTYLWNSINTEPICDSTKSIIPLGFIKPDKVNFLRIPYGKGNLYLHTNPIAFTNYFMRQQDKAEYAAGVFSHLRGRDVIWDEKSKIPFMGNNNRYDSPLYFIMQQPSLKYAWWLLLIATLLYVIFAVKRTQRIVPVLEVKSNTSLEYVKLISALHYQNSNHLDMARKKMKYFHYFIRNKYGIHAQTFTDDVIKKLSEKSKVSIADIQAIISQHARIEQDAFYNIEAGRLADFYYAIEHFYKHCK